MEHAAENRTPVSQLLQHPLLLPALLMVLTFAVYLPTFSANLLYTWNDQTLVLTSPFVRDLNLSSVVAIFYTPHFASYMPITQLTYTLEFLLWRDYPLGYHVFNVLLHALNGVLLFWLLTRMTGSRYAALVAAVLFIVHPVQVETVAWVSQRRALLSTCFLLLAWLAHLRSTDQSAPRWTIALAWGAYALAMLSDAVAFLAPVLWLVYDLVWVRLPARATLVRSLPYWGVAIVGLMLHVWAISVGGTPYNDVAFGRSVWEQAAFVLRLVWDYSASLVAPIGLNNLYLYAIEEVNASFLLPIFGLLILAALGWLAWRGGALVRFGLLWVALLLLPVINIIVPMGIARADRYLYMPFVGIALLCGIGFMALWRRATQQELRYVLLGGLIAVLSLFSILAFGRSTVWRNDATLWTDHLLRYPTSVTGLYNRALYFSGISDNASADIALTQMLQIYPDDFRANRLLGLNALALEDYTKAVLYLERARQVQPRDADVTARLAQAYFLLGRQYYDQRNYLAALDNYNQAANYAPPDLVPVLANNVGVTYYDMGRFQEAVAAYAIALRNQPDYLLAWVNLAEASLALNDYGQARDAYNQAIRLGAELNARASSNFCLILTELRENQQQALNYCDRSVSLEPTNGLYLGRKAYALMRWGDAAQAATVAQQAIAIAPDLALGYRVLGDAQFQLGNRVAAEAAYRQALVIDPTNAAARAGLLALGVSVDLTPTPIVRGTPNVNLTPTPPDVFNTPAPTATPGGASATPTPGTPPTGTPTPGASSSPAPSATATATPTSAPTLAVTQPASHTPTP